MQNYVENAIRTESVVNTINIDTRLLHAIIGINTEAVELLENTTYNLVNILEELGDIFWYIAILCDCSEIDFNELIDKKIKYNPALTGSHIIKNIVINASSLLDISKKQIYYNKLISKDILYSKVSELITLMLTLCSIFDFDVNEILEKNIAKLTARYPDKFCEIKANNRDLEKEYSILES